MLLLSHGSRHLIRIWVAKFDAGDLDSDQGAAHLLADYEARIAALERLACKLALENDFLKGALQHDRRPKKRDYIRSSAMPGWPLTSVRTPRDLLNDKFTEDQARALLAWLNEHRDVIHLLKFGPVPIKSREADAPCRSGASHALSTQVLDDNNEAEGALGIAAGLAWSAKADAVVVYTDHGISAGVQLGIDRAVREGRPVEYRRLEDKT